MSTQHGETPVETRLRKMVSRFQRLAANYADATIEDIREGEWVDTCVDGARQVMNLAHRAEACEIGAEAVAACRAFLAKWAEAEPHFVNAFSILLVHDMKYSGPTLVPELDAMRALLQRAGADR